MIVIPENHIFWSFKHNIFLKLTENTPIIDATYFNQDVLITFKLLLKFP